MRRALYLCGILFENTSLIKKKTLDNSSLKNILQNTWLVFPEIVKDTKNKEAERLAKDRPDLGQLHEKCGYLGWETGTEKHVSGKNYGNPRLPWWSSG